MLGEGRSLAGDEGMERVACGVGEGPRPSAFPSEGSVGAERNGPPARQKQLCPAPPALRERPHARVFVELHDTPVSQPRYLHPFARRRPKHIPIEFGWTSQLVPGFNRPTLGPHPNAHLHRSLERDSRLLRANPAMNRFTGPPFLVVDYQ